MVSLGAAIEVLEKYGFPILVSGVLYMSWMRTQHKEAKRQEQERRDLLEDHRLREKRADEREDKYQTIIAEHMTECKDATRELVAALQKHMDRSEKVRDRIREEHELFEKSMDKVVNFQERQERTLDHLDHTLAGLDKTIEYKLKMA